MKNSKQDQVELNYCENKWFTLQLPGILKYKLYTHKSVLLNAMTFLATKGCKHENKNRKIIKTYI